MKEQPNYYSILTANVRYDSRLKGDEKVLFSEITALATKQGFCYATNQYFVDVFSDVSKGTISRRINHLKELGYLKIVVIRDENKQIKQRKMYPITDPIINSDDTPIRKSEGDPIVSSDDTPIVRTGKGNTTRFNTTRVNSSCSSAEQKDEPLNAFAYAQTVGMPITGKQQPVFIDYIDELGEELVIHALDYMNDHASKNNFVYLQQILNSYSKNGVDTIEKAEKLEQLHKEKSEQKYKNNNRQKQPIEKEKLPEWAKHPESTEKVESKYTEEERAKLKKRLAKFKKKDLRKEIQGA